LGWMHVIRMAINQEEAHTLGGGGGTSKLVEGKGRERGEKRRRFRSSQDRPKNAQSNHKFEVKTLQKNRRRERGEGT